MKKLLVLIITLTLNTTFAQEKQNDATWEETIDFIDKYKTKLQFDKYLQGNGRTIASRREYANRKKK